MDRHIDNKNWWIGILLLALSLLTLTLTYQNSGEYRNVTFDQREYYRLSIALADRFPIDVNIASALFNKLNVKVLEDDTLLMKRLSFRGPAYPAFLAGAQLLTQSASINSLRVSQALLLLCSLLMLFFMVKSRLGERYALLTAVLFTLYLPFIYMTPMLLTENLALFFIVLTAYLSFQLKSFAGRHWKFLAILLCLSITLTLLYLTRPVYIYFTALYIPVILFAIIKTEFSLPRRSLFFVIFVFSLLLFHTLWQAQVSSMLGLNTNISSAGGRDISRTLNESYDLENDGYPQPRVSSVKSRPESTRWLTSVKENIISSAFLRAEKFYRLWHMPAISYSNPFILPHKLTTIYHISLVFLAIVGLGLIRNKIDLFILSSPIIYTSIVYTGFFTEEHRFIYPVMPLVIILAVHTLYSLSHLSRSSSRQKGLLSIAFVLSAGLAVIAFPYGDSFHWWLSGTGGRILYYTVFISGTFILTLGCLRLARHFNFSPANQPLFYFFLISALIAVIVHGLIYRDWHIWSENIGDPSSSISQVISLRETDMEGVKYAFLQIDMLDDDGSLSDIDFSLDGIKLVDSSTLYPSMFHKVAYLHTYPLPPLHVKKKLELEWAMYPKMRSWAVFPVPLYRLQDKDHIKITIKATELYRNGSSIIYGSYRSDSQSFCGPRLRVPQEAVDLPLKNYQARFSLWKYHNTNDIRLFGCQPYSGAKNSSPQNDLNEVRDIREYGIRLQLIMNNGSELIF